MVAKKKEAPKEETESQESKQSFQERALQRLEEQGDTRVPSDPENFKPADIPPEPLTRSE
jgi:hypothetical protein